MSQTARIKRNYNFNRLQYLSKYMYYHPQLRQSTWQIALVTESQIAPKLFIGVWVCVFIGKCSMNVCVNGWKWHIVKKPVEWLIRLEKYCVSEIHLLSYFPSLNMNLDLKPYYCIPKQKMFLKRKMVTYTRTSALALNKGGVSKWGRKMICRTVRRWCGIKEKTVFLVCHHGW